MSNRHSRKPSSCRMQVLIPPGGVSPAPWRPKRLEREVCVQWPTCLHLRSSGSSRSSAGNFSAASSSVTIF